MVTGPDLTDTGDLSQDCPTLLRRTNTNSLLNLGVEGVGPHVRNSERILMYIHPQKMNSIVLDGMRCMLMPFVFTTLSFCFSLL